MADANSMGLVPVHSYGPDGRARYANQCPVCGQHRLSRSRSYIGKMCKPCVIAKATKAAAVRSRPPAISKHPLYKVFSGMRARCECKGATGYSNYGARGIYVCDEWRHDPPAFMAWAETHGYTPGLEVDRIDNDGPYAPWNCQFITSLANTRKSRNAKLTEERVRAIKAALSAGLSAMTVAKAEGLLYAHVWRIKAGYSWKDI